MTLWSKCCRIKEKVVWPQVKVKVTGPKSRSHRLNCVSLTSDKYFIRLRSKLFRIKRRSHMTSQGQILYIFTGKHNVYNGPFLRTFLIAFKWVLLYGMLLSERFCEHTFHHCDRTVVVDCSALQSFGSCLYLLLNNLAVSFGLLVVTYTLVWCLTGMLQVNWFWTVQLVSSKRQWRKSIICSLLYPLKLYYWASCERMHE